MVMVAVNDQLGGAIELQAAVRPEVRAIIGGLRERGIKHIAIISGDHDAPTRKLAESLGMDRYFAQVLPADKADYVAKLQAEGCKVCFVGDGINDSIALKKADVSISLRGASSIATDTAHIVFLEGGLSKLCELRDIARDLDRNVSRSWSMILAPNLMNVFGGNFCDGLRDHDDAVITNKRVRPGRGCSPAGCSRSARSRQASRAPARSGRRRRPDRLQKTLSRCRYPEWRGRPIRAEPGADPHRVLAESA